jgi:hypothetical protein
MSEMQKSDNIRNIDIREIFKNLKKYWQYLLSKWVIILIFGLSGGAIGLGLSFILKPDYNAHLSFALIEKSPGTSGLASLASSFGFGGLLGGGSAGAFSGDNLIEIIKSRYAVENALLTPVIYHGKKQNMIDVYIDFNELHDKWKNAKNIELRTLNYPVDLPREKFTRTQDSILFSVYSLFMKTGDLSVVRKDKKISIVNVDFKSNDEQFSKEFVENLMKTTYDFYKQTRTSQSRANIVMMEHVADSVRNLYEKALYGSAGISQININTAYQTAAVPKIKNENDAILYGAVYAEVLKNLETLKLDLARETPIVQIIDSPRYPLKKDKLGKLKGIILGGLVGGIIITAYLLLMSYFKREL